MNLCGHLPRTSNRRHIASSPWSFRHQGADVPSLVTLSPGLGKRTQVTSMRKLTRLLATAVANAPSSLRKYSTFLDPTTSFSSLGLGPDACQAVAVGGFTSPARIQARHPYPEWREPTKKHSLPAAHACMFICSLPVTLLLNQQDLKHLAHCPTAMLVRPIVAGSVAAMNAVHLP
jgi:hypothetical protein